MSWMRLDVWSIVKHGNHEGTSVRVRFPEGSFLAGDPKERS